jgi:lipoprotein
MAIFFKNNIVVNRSCDEILSMLSASTILSCDRMNYGKKGEFRGNVWQNGFRIALNTYYWNSFESQAVGYVEPFGDNKCTVHLSIGPRLLVLIIMCAWNIGLLVALIAVSISSFSEDISKGFAAMLLFLPFIAADVLFLRFSLYSNYKKLKVRILDILV